MRVQPQMFEACEGVYRQRVSGPAATRDAWRFSVIQGGRAHCKRADAQTHEDQVSVWMDHRAESQLVFEIGAASIKRSRQAPMTTSFCRSDVSAGLPRTAWVVGYKVAHQAEFLHFGTISW